MEERKKIIFASLRHIVPSDMEEYLENMQAKGFELRSLADGSLFYFPFGEAETGKAKYAVDSTGLSKALYMQMLIDKGWEYLGRSMNCYIWRKKYEGSDRPSDFTDKAGLKKHCLIQGAVFMLLALVMLALYVFMVLEITGGYKMGNDIKKMLITYIIFMVIQLPILIYLVWAGIKLLAAAGRYGRMEDIRLQGARGPVMEADTDEEEGGDVFGKEKEE